MTLSDRRRYGIGCQHQRGKRFRPDLSNFFARRAQGLSHAIQGHGIGMKITNAPRFVIPVWVQ